MPDHWTSWLFEGAGAFGSMWHQKNTGSEQVTGAVLALFRQLCGGHIAVLCEEVPKLLFNASFWYTRDVDLLQDWYQRVGYHHATHVELLVISNHRCGKIK